MYLQLFFISQNTAYASLQYELIRLNQFNHKNVSNNCFDMNINESCIDNFTFCRFIYVVN